MPGKKSDDSYEFLWGLSSKRLSCQVEAEGATDGAPTASPALNLAPSPR